MDARLLRILVICNIPVLLLCTCACLILDCFYLYWKILMQCISAVLNVTLLSFRNNDEIMDDGLRGYWYWFYSLFVYCMVLRHGGVLYFVMY